MSGAKNIILMTIDDGGAYHRFRAAFGEMLQTPNLDRISALATMFTSAYCQTPICGPSRNSMLSGLAPHQTGLLDNYTNLFEALRPEQLWQHRIKQAGYYCSTAGKVHHSFAPIAAQHHNVLYSHPAKRITLGPPRTAAVKRYGGLTGGAGTTDPEDDAVYYDHQSASDAIAFLETYDQPAPFYREVGFHHPHIPLKTPARFKDMYDEDAFVQPAAWADGFDAAGYPDQYMIENMDLRDDRFWRKSVRNYFSAYSHVDHHIGRVWDALQASRHAKHTILVVTSDHGFHLGDKNRMRKFTLWEETCCVPLIVYDPDHAPQVVDDPVALLDIGPTLLDYTDCAPLAGAPGRSLVPQIGGARQPDRAVPTFLFGNVGLRKGDHRIIRYENGETELYDLTIDPWATRNLGVDHPAHAPLLAELHDVSADHGLHLSPQAGQGRAVQISRLDANVSTALVAPPGQRVHFSTLAETGTAPLPAGYTMMNYGADTGGDVKAFAAKGNADDNNFLFPGSFNRFVLTVSPGPGCNTVISQNDDLIVYCGSGGTTIQPGNSRAVCYGGAGADVIYTGKARAWIDGGAGPLTLFAGSGEVEVVTGHSHNMLNFGTGPTRACVNGGTNELRLQHAEVHITLMQTGLPQAVHGFQGGVIDVRDWAAFGLATLTAVAGNIVLACGTERVVFHQAGHEIVAQSLTGVDVVTG